MKPFILSAIFTTTFLFGTTNPNPYHECVDRLLNSVPKPLTSTMKRQLLVSISNNCKEKSPKSEKLLEECRNYIIRSKRELGARAILKRFSHCDQLSEKMNRPSFSNESCSVRICQIGSTKENCIERPADFFGKLDQEYCSKWVPYSRCVLDATNFREKTPVYVYWQSGSTSGKIACTDL